MKTPHCLRLFWIALFLLGATVFSVGCNTMEGAGEDVEATGEAIQRAAD